MKAAYVDSSCLIALEFAEPGATALRKRLRSFDILLSSNLLEAEVRSACNREHMPGEPDTLGAVTWVIPDRTLSDELRRVFSAGYVRGADGWHLATALYVSSEPGALTFITLDERQREVARSLGFKV